MLNEAQARQILERVNRLVRARKGEGIGVLSTWRRGNARFAVNEITSSADVDGTQLAVTAQFGQRSSTATTNQLDDRAIEAVVARAVSMAKISPENPEELPPLGRQAYLPVKNARDAGTVALSPEARAKSVAAALAAASSGAAARIAIAGFYQHANTMWAVSTTQGAWAHHAFTTAKFTCTARTADGTGSGWAGVGSNRVGDLEHAELAKIAVDKAVRSMKPTRLEPGRYTVVLEPAAVIDLLAFLGRAFDARRADEGRSFFSKKGGGTRLGEKLFPDSITLRTAPTDPQLSASPFDGEGLPRAAATWIDKGTVRALAYNRFWAKKQGKPATSTPDGWILDGGTTPRAELIKGVQRGVLITRFWYLRALDPQTLLVTGLTRDGVFLIENGAVTRPVNNFRFNESPVQMLNRCDALSPTALVDAAGQGQSNARIPALRTHEFNLASISEAV